ncbi:MAG TPA: hypothetical protein VK612_02855 [Pyrinomonadaceae bacterium]|nr:hypothetical protein [Pyrinomonadaceae bacterium]
MLGKNILRKSVCSLTAIAVLCVYSSWVLALPGVLTGEITVVGQVTVNGQPAVSNSTIISGSTIVTGSNSSAIVSLGKTGRVEVLADSNLVLNFSESNIVGILSSGKARVANAAGVATTVTTKDAAVIADAGQADNFIVEVECSHTHVDATTGIVTMREGSNDRQVAAGTSATAGNLAQTGCKPCLRPDSAPPVNFGVPWWVFLVAGGIVVTTILINKDPEDPDDEVIVVSPTR